MQTLLVLARGIYDREGRLPAVSLMRLDAAIAWAAHHPETTIFTAAYVPPTLPVGSPAVATVMAEYLRTHGAVQVRALTEPSPYNTRGELEKFLNVADGDIVIVSSRYHLPRIFCYVWELKGWQCARAVTYVPVYDRCNWRDWWLEFQKLCVIALPYPLQRCIEEWYARRTETYEKVWE